MSLNSLRWSAHYYLCRIWGKAWLFYFRRIRGMSRDEALIELIRRNTDNPSSIKGY